MEKARELLRIQRHDFLNHMQVVYGYLQLNKADKAMDYIKKAVEEIRSQGVELEKELEREDG